MMQKIYILLLSLIIFFTGCEPYRQDMTTTPNRVTNKEKKEIDLRNLESYSGEYVIGDLKITPKVALTTKEYAKENTTLPGESLTINAEFVLFDQETFYCVAIEKMNHDKTRRYFNITSGEANLLCGGGMSKDGVAMGDLEVYHFYTMDHSKWITLILKEDDKLMLWVGEKYDYIGFYELLPAVTQG